MSMEKDVSTTIGEFSPFTYGKGLPKQSRNHSGNIPVYGSNGVIDYHDTSLTNAPTIIVGRKGTIGAVHFSPFPCWPIDTTFYISDSDFLMLRFKYYMLKSLGLESMNSDSAVPGLNREIAHAINIILPSIKQQKYIAYILGTLDDKIEMNRRISKTIEEIARALFKSWFVDFDPVRAKTEGRWKPGQSIPGLPAELYDMFPDRFITSELGEIPEGWEVSSLDQIADFINGLALQRFPADDNNYLPVIKIAEMRRGYTASTAKASLDIDSKYIVNDGDLLFSWSGSLEVVLWAHGTGALNQHLFKVTSDIYPKWFYYGWITEYLDEFRQIAAGKATTMGHIQRHHLKDSKIAIPSYDLFELGDKILGPVLDKYVLSSVENRGLTEMRDALLPKLLSGEIRVEDLEGILG